jgi:hypothetical protein
MITVTGKDDSSQLDSSFEAAQLSPTVERKSKSLRKTYTMENLRKLG